MKATSISLSIAAALFAQLGCDAESAEQVQEDAVANDAPTSAATGALLAACQAQRAVHVVAGTGGLAWFSQVWPLPIVITNFQNGWAYDNPANAKAIATEVSHPLYARKLGTRAVWEGRGTAPHPSVFVAGFNETHTGSPTSITTYQGASLPAAGAALQASLQPVIPALVFGAASQYGTAPGAPAPVVVADVEGAIAAFQGKITPAQEQLLRPSASQLVRYVPLNASAVEFRFARTLAFTANALALGLVGTVVLPSYNDDPHGAFDTGIVTTRTNRLATTLDAFYADLSLFQESLCGDRSGAAISLANNTVMTVVGDTPKSFTSTAGWPDGTLASSNWMYLRSNGFTRPGWFGKVTNTNPTRTNFNPTTGDLDLTATPAADSAAAFAGSLYSIARGNTAAVAAFTTAPYAGVRQ